MSSLKKEQINELTAHYSHDMKVEGLTVYIQPYLDAMAARIPTWIAPNVITISAGALITVVTIAVLVTLPQLHGYASPSLCILAILGTVGFVLLDNLDGRHAKRTGNCSKLGDFLDHGVDSIADPLSVLMMAVIAQGGYSVPLWLFLVGMVMVCFINYVYLWSDRHTKICYVTDLQLEAYLFITFIVLLTAIFGSDIWIYNLRQILPTQYLSAELQHMIPKEIPLNVSLITISLLLPTTEFYDAISRVLVITKSIKPLKELFPPLLISLGLAVWGIYSPSDIFKTQKLVTTLLTIVIFSLVTGRYNLARLTNETVTSKWEVFAILLVSVFVAATGYDDTYLLPAFFAFITLGTLHFYCVTVRDMARALGVPVFTTMKKR